MLPVLYNNPSMPVGIPMPTVQFLKPTPEPPENWTEEVAGYYYIDSSIGADEIRDESGVFVPRTYGTPLNPRFTIPTTIPAGSVVIIKGIYLTSTNTALYPITAQGTDEPFIAGVQGPVWVTTDKDDQCIIVNRPIGWYGNNFYLDNIHMGAGIKVQLGTSNNGYDWSSNNVVVRHCDMSQSLSVIGSNLTMMSNVVLYDNHVHDGGDIESTSDVDITGVQINPNVNNVWVLANHLEYMQGAGIQILGKTYNTQRIFVGWNHIHHVRQSGVWTKYGRYIVISSNYIHHIITTQDKVASSKSPSKGIGGQYDPASKWILNNVIHDCSYPIRFAGFNGGTTDPSYFIIGNIIYNAYPQGDPIKGEPLNPDHTWGVSGMNLIGGRERHIYNNLILSSPFSMKLPLSSLAKTYIKNNILMCVPYVDENGIARKGANIYTGNSVIGDERLFIESNYFGGDMRVTASSKNYTTAEELNANGGVNNVQGPVLYTLEQVLDAIDNNIIEGLDLSGIKDLGADVSSIIVDRYKAEFGGDDSIAEDILTRTRIQGGKIDIGPFEVGNSFQERKPAKPSGVFINATTQSIEWDVVLGNYTHSIYKNGELLADNINPVDGSYFIEGITSSVDKYIVVAGNEVDYTIGDELNSMIITVNPYSNVDDLSLVTNYFLPRVKERKDSSLLIADLSFEGVLYGLPKNNVRFKVEEGVEKTGYVYVDANEGGVISGGVAGDGVVTFIVVDSAKQGGSVEGGLYINDTKINMVNTGGFNVQRVTVEFSGVLPYTIKSYGDTNGFLGLAAIIGS